MENGRKQLKRSHAERSQMMRQRLIESTIGIIQNHGFEAATFFEVAKCAGVTPGAIQHHFKSKGDLMMEVLNHLIKEGHQAGKLWPSSDLPPNERARLLVGNAWQLIYRHPRFVAAWSTYLGCKGKPELLAHIARQRADLMRELRPRFLASFPELADAPDADGFIGLVFSALRGMGLLQLFDADGAATQQQLESLAKLIASRCAMA